MYMYLLHVDLCCLQGRSYRTCGAVQWCGGHLYHLPPLHHLHHHLSLRPHLRDIHQGFPERKDAITGMHDTCSTTYRDINFIRSRHHTPDSTIHCSRQTSHVIHNTLHITNNTSRVTNKPYIIYQKTHHKLQNIRHITHHKNTSCITNKPYIIHQNTHHKPQNIPHHHTSENTSRTTKFNTHHTSQTHYTSHITKHTIYHT